MVKSITLNHITKIEGHAKLNLSIAKNKVKKCELSATEGSRYFEGLVIGRKFSEAHEITSRICGICSCAHVITAILAVEHAFNYTPSKQTSMLRELMTLGERIRSHATHLYFLALPDYLGYESAISMAPSHKKEIMDALNLMKLGNGIIKLLGSRDLHPVSATIGGWLRLPEQDGIDKISEDLKKIKQIAIKTFMLFNSLDYPKFASLSRTFSLVKKNQYAVLDGKFKSEDVSFEKKDYRKYIEEYQVPYSTANFVSVKKKPYMVGALARLNNNKDYLSRDAKKLLKKSNIKIPSHNPFDNNIAQAIELVHCVIKAIDICEKLSIKREPVDKLTAMSGIGIGAVEVPRGTLWHEYQFDGPGNIIKANIITPTAQNLLNIQEDIRNFVPLVVDKDKKVIINSIEKLIRSYDPCFSCSAHFLEVNWI